MKGVNVKNIEIQFDVDNSADMLAIHNTLNKFNTMLQKHFIDNTPYIFTGAIDDDDIEITDLDDE